MVIVRITGGLGNQMFQYAAGRAVSLRLNTDLKLDLGFLKHPPRGTIRRKYGLSVFNIRASLADSKEVRKFVVPRTGNSMMYRLRKTVRRYETNVIREAGFCYNPAVMTAPVDCYLLGDWQSEKYFKGIEDVVREEYDLEGPATKKNSRLADHIMSCESVGIHVRRGDYVYHERTRRLHGGVCDPDYYSRAASLIESLVTNPCFVVFSDDIGWCRTHLKFRHPTVFSDPFEGNEVEDLRLMSLCKHNIIANSSYSWWAAWLNGNQGKVVVAPKKWFRDDSRKIDDLLPEAWLKV